MHKRLFLPDFKNQGKHPGRRGFARAGLCWYFQHLHKSSGGTGGIQLGTRHIFMSGFPNGNGYIGSAPASAEPCPEQGGTGADSVQASRAGGRSRYGLIPGAQDPASHFGQRSFSFGGDEILVETIAKLTKAQPHKLSCLTFMPSGSF